MHELAVCNELLNQVRATAAQRDARSVGRITVRIGALSGVEPELLEHAFTIARAGDYTGNATLVVETTPVRIRCRACGHENEAAPNRLLCNACGGYAVDLLGGDELLLASIELHGIPEPDSTESEPGTPGEESYV